MKEEKMTWYKIVKPVLGTIYKLWYNPKVIGKENIPTDGPIVVAGNHVHIMDQCNVIIGTKRCLHYMAKKEYFDGKFAFFFKAVGCIPVDRSKKDESATASALEVLNNKQALGIFPEGTRNGLKEERIKEGDFAEASMIHQDKMSYEDFYKKAKKNKTSLVNYLEELKNEKIITKEEFLDNITNADGYLNDLIVEKRITKQEYIDHILLPLKFGAVSLASKTNAKIVPYAITGDYKFRSKNLVIRIGKPFEPGNDLAKANEKLDKELKELIKENLKK